ncbi:MAG: hypothetical protein V3T58_05550 [Candidatus Hydrothermarchaeales archaeon]
MPEEGIRCPACGQEHTPDMVVGKTQTFNRGVRTTYEVVHCECGKTYRGNMVAQQERKERK